jgi:hypothetical protein
MCCEITDVLQKKSLDRKKTLDEKKHGRAKINKFFYPMLNLSNVSGEIKSTCVGGCKRARAHDQAALKVSHKNAK